MELETSLTGTYKSYIDSSRVTVYFIWVLVLKISSKVRYAYKLIIIYSWHTKDHTVWVHQSLSNEYLLKNG